MNKVTVYITNYNYHKFLPSAIDSVVNQTYSNIELILVDDGSTDGSLGLIEEYRKNIDFKLIKNKRKGLIGGCNDALRIATGDLIVRLDADDYFELNAIELMVEEFQLDSELDLVFPDYYIVNSENKRISERRRHDFAKVTLRDLPAHGACTMIRTDKLRAIGGYSTRFDRQDGYYLWLKIGLDGRVKNIRKPLFSYRRHGLNLTSNQSQLLGVRRKIKRYCVEDEPLKSTTIILPLRSWEIGENHLVNAKNGNGVFLVIEYLEKFLVSEMVADVIVVLDSNKNYLNRDLLQLLQELQNVHLIYRPPLYESLDEDLMKTIRAFPSEVKKIFSKNICVASYEIPNITTDIFEEHVDSLYLFRAEVVIGVSEITKNRWRHNGKSLVLSDTKIARESDDEFIHAGGLIVFTTAWFEKELVIQNSIISHVLIEDWRNLKVNNPLVLELHGYGF